MEDVVVGDVDAQEQIVSDVGFETNRRTGDDLVIVVLKVIAADVALEAVATQQRQRTASFDVEARVGRFDEIVLVADQSEPSGAQGAQAGRNDIVVRRHWQVGVGSQVKVAAHRFQTDARLVVRLLVAVVVVVPTREAIDAILMLIEIAQTGTDVGIAGPRISRGSATIHEHDKVRIGKTERDHRADTGRTVVLAAEPFADASFQTEPRADVVLPNAVATVVAMTAVVVEPFGSVATELGRVLRQVVVRGGRHQLGGWLPQIHDAVTAGLRVRVGDTVFLSEGSGGESRER